MPSLSIHNLNVWYGAQHAIKDISVDIPPRQITAVIGPSGCGKSTLLKSLNRLLDLNERVRVEGQVLLDGDNIYAVDQDATEIRTRIGLLAQKPFPLPMSIFDNVAYGPRIHGLANGNIQAVVQSQLESVGLWEEVKDRLSAPASGLSVGQQQRLCLARTLAVQPEVLLCDESTASLDPISARGVESLIRNIKTHYTVIMVTHDIDQARRVADYVLFMWLGELIEHGPAQQFFTAPAQPLSQAYLAREVG
ncbi:MAG: phosphate ABC transporter ATP-binding protein [Chloroflexota bacterium]|jgi:phosphate transport system ATP-binding protein|nr:phosphate ABC transporter ATP-binding protein [Chloroflexota bacterium]